VHRMPLLHAAVKMGLVFIGGSLLLGGTLWLALPTLDEEDRPLLHVPKSFVELQALNTLLKKYKDIYPFRTVVCFVVTYLFLQAFSLPGSMYLSILAGAVWGMTRALPLCCACVATGATLCYLISAALGPALLAIPKWKERVDKWAEKVDAQRANLLSFLIVLRIAPFPPHWVVNVVCPHLGIGIPMFWISTFLGVLGVTIIHTTIGGGLDQMTSADDFHLISWRNFFGLSAIVVAVLIPVGLRYYWRNELKSVAEAEQEAQEGYAYGAVGGGGEIVLDDSSVRRGVDVDRKGKGAVKRDGDMNASMLVLLSDDEDEGQGQGEEGGEYRDSDGEEGKEADEFPSDGRWKTRGWYKDTGAGGSTGKR